MTHLEQVYERHGIYDVPDPDLNEPIPEPFPRFEQFEREVMAALVLDGKRTPPAAPEPEPPHRPTPRARQCTLGCVCSTPLVVNAQASVVYQDEPHLACYICGRILSIDHEAYDKRIRDRCLAIMEEQFMVDQVREPIHLRYRR